MRVPFNTLVYCCALTAGILFSLPAEAAHPGHGHGGHGHGGHHHGGGWSGGYGGSYGYGGGYGYPYRGFGIGYSSGYASTSFFGSGLTIGLGSFGLGYGGYGGYGYPYNNVNIVSGPIYPYASSGVWGPYSNYGPLYLPSDQLYGPGALPAWSLPQALNGAGAVQQPIAGQQPFGQGALAPPRVGAPAQAPAPAQPAAQAPNEPKPRVPSNDEALKRGFKFLDFGDQLFAQQKFLEAYLRYQDASSAAPDLSDAHFRRGFALLALGYYDRAAEAMRRGITLNREWSKSPFKLDDLYADNKIAKRAHQEQLALALEKEPENANAMFLLGVMLYFDDQHERSRPFLQKALQLMKSHEAVSPAAVPAVQAGPARAGDLEF